MIGRLVCCVWMVWNSCLFFLFEVVLVVKFMFWMIRLKGCFLSSVRFLVGLVVMWVLMLCRDSSSFRVWFMLGWLLMIRMCCMVGRIGWFFCGFVVGVF